MGAGPWEPGDVVTFLRPAYDALAPKLGKVASFTCTQGMPDGSGFEGAPAERTFLCIAVFLRGTSSGRVFSLDERGAVARESDLPEGITVNPGVECADRGVPELDLAACADLPAEIEPVALPPLDRSLYGRDGPPLSGQPGNPAECGEVGDEDLTAVKIPCVEASRVAKVTVRTPSCAPKRGKSVVRCHVEKYACEFSANADASKPWAGGCSTAPPGSSADDSDSIAFSIPVSG